MDVMLHDFSGTNYHFYDITGTNNVKEALNYIVKKIMKPLLKMKSQYILVIQIIQD